VAGGMIGKIEPAIASEQGWHHHDITEVGFFPRRTSRKCAPAGLKSYAANTPKPSGDSIVCSIVAREYDQPAKRYKRKVAQEMAQVFRARKGHSLTINYLSGARGGSIGQRNAWPRAGAVSA